jgi:DNA-binding NtrC family response regulator
VPAPEREAPAERRAAGEPWVLVVDDEEMMRTMLASELPRLGFHVKTAGSGGEGVALAAAEDFAVAIVDVLMPSMDGMETLQRLKQESPGTEVVMLTGHGTIESAVAAMRAGAYDYLTKPCRLAELATVLNRAVSYRRLERENAALKMLMADRRETGSLVAVSARMRGILGMVERIALADAPILIQGESGTGKELIARELHELSRRREKPLVVLNCSAIPDTLLESELFGHQRGAFTGAHERRLGLMEAADGGTIFLDEIADMSPAVQAKMLRALESGEVRRVGENRTTHVDVRVVAATNKDLRKEVGAGRFREDLFYRLTAVVLELPPLRERLDDIEPLVRHFMAAFPARDTRVREFSADAMTALRSYSWPGNVRELKNCVAAVLILAAGPRVELSDLPASVRGSKPPPKERSAEAIPLRRLEDVVGDYVRQALERCGGNKSLASRMLGIDPKTLYKHLRRVPEAGD